MKENSYECWVTVKVIPVTIEHTHHVCYAAYLMVVLTVDFHIDYQLTSVINLLMFVFASDTITIVMQHAK